MTPRAEISEAPHSVDLECGKRKQTRSQEDTSKATGRETVDENIPVKEKVLRSISVLNRTRESLADESCLDKPGQLLDKALAKQIKVREAELDSLAKNTPIVNNNVSVIVRSSTPDPNAPCRNHQEPHFHPLTPQAVPEDHSLPLNYFLRSLQDPEEPQLPPTHPIQQQEGASLNFSAPQVPWTPPRIEEGPEGFRHPNQSSNLLELLSSSRTSCLLAPLIQADIKETKMDLDEEKNSCESNLRKYNRLLRRYDPSKVDPESVKTDHREWKREISAALDVVVDSIESLVLKHGSSLGTGATAQWNSRITESEEGFRIFTNNVTSQLKVIAAPLAVPQPTHVPPPVPDPVNTTGRLKAAEAEIMVEDDIVTREGKKLESEVEKVEWEEATNEEIEEAMGMIDDWKKRFTKLQDRISTIKRNVLTFSLSDVRLKALEAFVHVIEKKMEEAVKDIRKQDGKRGLYSLSKSKAADVKLPKFGGKIDQDFSKFKNEMMKGFKSNKVRREDQVKKLRENLFDQPKTLIQEGLESIEVAWKILEDMYGDSERVLNAKKKKIKELSRFPTKGKGGYLALCRSQIEWLIKLEVAINDVIKLGEEGDQLDRDAFSSSTITTIQGMFPIFMQEELMKFFDPDEKDGKERLYRIVEYLQKVRRNKQELQKTAENNANDRFDGYKAENPGDSHDNPTAGQDDGGRGYRKKNSHAHQVNNCLPSCATAYRQPTRDTNCRVCKHLSKKGTVGELFDKHFNDIAIGCPRFMELSLEARSDLIKRCKICERCLHPKDEVDETTAHANCRAPPDINKKKPFTCAKVGCHKHYLICSDVSHGPANKEKRERTRKFWNSKGIVAQAVQVCFKPDISKEASLESFNKSGNPVDEKEGEKVAVAATGRENTAKVFDVNTNKVAEADETEVDLKKATKKLKAVVEGIKVMEVPKGEPLFLFSSAVGKTRPINVFYDKGCSHVVF